jgi:two-component system LytT family response regulator
MRGRVYLSEEDYLPIGENYKENFQRYIGKTFKNL